MTPIVFGPPGRRLFGLLHLAAQPAPKPHGVLLCNPFGQESVRVHRLFRVLAERLCRAGVHVLRFDYFGCGDSPGADDEGDLAGWVGDVGVAQAELTSRSGCQRQTWVGARLGATLACMASRRITSPPSRLVLWEPVMDGKGYLLELAKAHVDTLEASFSLPDPRWRRDLELMDPATIAEAIGFQIGQSLRHQLLSLNETSMEAPQAAATTVLLRDGAGHAGALGRWRRENPSLDEVRFEHAFDWTSSEAMNTALVPPDALQLLEKLALTP